VKAAVVRHAVVCSILILLCLPKNSIYKSLSTIVRRLQSEIILMFWTFKNETKYFLREFWCKKSEGNFA
jgi:hypothetical protein